MPTGGPSTTFSAAVSGATPWPAPSPRPARPAAAALPGRFLLDPAIGFHSLLPSPCAASHPARTAPSMGRCSALMITSAAAAGAWTGPIRSAQLNQYHQSPVAPPGAAMTSLHCARSCGSCTDRAVSRPAGMVMQAVHPRACSWAASTSRHAIPSWRVIGVQPGGPAVPALPERPALRWVPGRSRTPGCRNRGGPGWQKRFAAVRPPLRFRPRPAR